MSVDLTDTLVLLERLVLLDPSAILESLAREAKTGRTDPQDPPDLVVLWDPLDTPASLELLASEERTEVLVFPDVLAARAHVVTPDHPDPSEFKDNRVPLAILDHQGTRASVERGVSVDLEDLWDPTDLLALLDLPGLLEIKANKAEVALRVTKVGLDCPDPTDLPDPLVVSARQDRPDSVDPQDLPAAVELVVPQDAVVRPVLKDVPVLLVHVDLLERTDLPDLPEPLDHPDLPDLLAMPQSTLAPRPSINRRDLTHTCNTTSLLNPWKLMRA